MTLGHADSLILSCPIPTQTPTRHLKKEPGRREATFRPKNHSATVPAGFACENPRIPSRFSRSIAKYKLRFSRCAFVNALAQLVTP